MKKTTLKGLAAIGVIAGGAAYGYKKAMELLGTDVSNTLFVGDQIFTDIWGAKGAGLYSILLEPINPKEEIQIVLKRYLEKIVLFCYPKGVWR